MQTKQRTKLAARRIEGHHTQQQMVELTGISRASYIKLEQGRHPNPPLRWLTNCALVLGCQLEDLIDDELREWHVLDERAPAPPRDKSADKLAEARAAQHARRETHRPEWLDEEERREAEERALIERKLADQARLREEQRRRSEG